MTKWFWVVVPLAIAWIAYRHRDSVVLAFHLIRRANLAWLGAGAVAIGGVYLCRAGVYAGPLRLFGYRASPSFLWSTAVAATSLHQLVPAAGATGYAFLVYAFRQRGVPAGRASLVAVLDTLSHAVSLGALVLATLIYLTAGGALRIGSAAIAFTPGLIAALLGLWVYRLQRERRRFVPLVLRFKRRLASLLGRRWRDAPVEAFLGEYYEGKRIMQRHRRVFRNMIGLQLLAVVCDATALYVAFLAIGVAPSVWSVLLGFVVAMSGAAIVGAPGGGGSFEAILSAFWVARGLTAGEGLAAALLYRVVAFWLPVTVTAIILLRLRRRRRTITRDAPR